MARYRGTGRFLNWALGLSAFALSAVVCALLVMSVLDAKGRAREAEAERDRVQAQLLQVIDSLKSDVRALRADAEAKGFVPVVGDPGPASRPPTTPTTASKARAATTTTQRPGTSTTTTGPGPPSSTSTTQRPNQPVCTTLPITERCL